MSVALKISPNHSATLTAGRLSPLKPFPSSSKLDFAIQCASRKLAARLFYAAPEMKMQARAAIIYLHARRFDLTIPVRIALQSFADINDLLKAIGEDPQGATIIARVRACSR